MYRNSFALERRRILKQNDEIKQFRTFERAKFLAYEQEKLNYEHRIRNEIEKNRLLSIMPSTLDLARAHQHNMSRLASKEIEMKLYDEIDREKRQHELMTLHEARAKHARLKIDREHKQTDLLKIYELQRVLDYRERMKKYDQDLAQIESEHQLLKESTCNHLASNFMYDVDLDKIEHNLNTKKQIRIHALNKKYQMETDNFLEHIGKIQIKKYENQQNKEDSKRNLERISWIHERERTNEDFNSTQRYKLKQEFIENNRQMIDLMDQLNMHKIAKLEKDFVKLELKQEVNNTMRQQNYLTKILHERLKLEEEKNFIDKININELKRKMRFEHRLNKLRMP